MINKINFILLIKFHPWKLMLMKNNSRYYIDVKLTLFFFSKYRYLW